MAVPSWASLGSGLPDNFCAYNASSARSYEPQAVIDARKKLEAAQKEKEDLEKKREGIKCDACAGNFEKIISIVDHGQIKAYEDHMAGGGACTPLVSNVDIYNYWAEINDWEQIEERGGRHTAPNRMVASPNDNQNHEVGGGTPGNNGLHVPVNVPELETPGFSPTCPKYGGLHGSVDVSICDLAASGTFAEGHPNAGQSYISRDERRLCNTCLRKTSRYSSGRYGFCVNSEALLADLEDKIADLEDDLKDALDEAEDNGDEVVCADCMTDNRSFLEKWGPTLLVGGLTLYGANQAAKTQRESYEYYRDVIHPDNNAKGYNTDMMADTSGSVFSTVLISGVPTVINTALGSGAFGCSGSALFGSSVTTTGDSAGTQVGGLSGILSGLLGTGTSTTTADTQTTGVNGGYTIVNGQVVYNNTTTGTTGMTDAQIQAAINANNEALTVAQQRQTALANYAAYSSSVAAINQRTAAEIAALGTAPVLTSATTTAGVTAASGTSIYGSGYVQGGVSAYINAAATASATPPWMSAQTAATTTTYTNTNVAVPTSSLSNL